MAEVTLFISILNKRPPGLNSPGSTKKGYLLFASVVQKINLAEKPAKIDHYWDPRIVGQMNGQQVKLARFKGTFDWHQHDQEDKMFLVLEGSFELDLKDTSLHPEAGEMAIVPRGNMHRPRTLQEAHVMLFEPGSTLNTGNLRNEKTEDNPDEI